MRQGKLSCQCLLCWRYQALKYSISSIGTVEQCVLLLTAPLTIQPQMLTMSWCCMSWYSEPIRGVRRYKRAINAAALDLIDRKHMNVCGTALSKAEGLLKQLSQNLQVQRQAMVRSMHVLASYGLWFQ